MTKPQLLIFVDNAKSCLVYFFIKDIFNILAVSGYILLTKKTQNKTQKTPTKQTPPQKTAKTPKQQKNPKRNKQTSKQKKAQKTPKPRKGAQTNKTTKNTNQNKNSSFS